jgi:hypothetical protein
MPPLDDNALPVYNLLAELFATRKAASNSVASLISGNKPPTAESIRQLRMLVTPNSDLLLLIHKAASKNACVFPRDWSKGSDQFLFPEFATMRDAARWLIAEGLVKAAGGDGKGAIDAVSDNYAIANQASLDIPTGISVLVSIAIQNITLASMQKILYLTGGDSVTATAIEESISSKFLPVDIKSAIRFEMAAEDKDIHIEIPDTVMPDDVRSFVKSLAPDARVPDGLTAAQFLNEDLPPLLSRMRVLSDIIDGPLDRVHVLGAAIASESRSGGITDLVESMSLPTYVQIADRRAQSIAQARVLRVGAEALTYFAKTGSYPQSLLQIDATNATDPFGNGLLGYRQEPGGFVVYSAGDGGKYDASDLSSAPKSSEPTFRWPLPGYLANSPG